jgi:hypothetical protein
MIRRLPILASEIAISATDWGKECEQAVQKSGCCIAHESRKHGLLDSISYCGNNHTVGHMGFSLWNEPRFPCSQRPRFDDRRCYLGDWIYLQKRILAGSRVLSLEVAMHKLAFNNAQRPKPKKPKPPPPRPPRPPPPPPAA